MNTQHNTEVDEAKKRFNEMWDNGEFEWNHHEGDEVGKKEISPNRIFNTFVVPLLQSNTKAVEERIIEWVEENWTNFYESSKPLADFKKQLIRKHLTTK